jgi:FHA domain-containing protein
MKSVRQIAIADHLWDVLSRMAEDMGSDREALLNQALHQLARQHGYLGAPGDATDTTPGPDRSERLAVAERVLETAARLERAMHDRTPGEGPLPLGEEAGSTLRIRRDDGREWEVGRDRFLIGRGRHCDLVIDSTKVSREHAAIVRAEDGWWIEDLGSANGTWFQQQRVQRRRIDDGDEYFVCAERIRCAVG